MRRNEETTYHRVGGEGDSSRAHGIPDGDWDDELWDMGHSIKSPLTQIMSQGRKILITHAYLGPGPPKGKP